MKISTVVGGGIVFIAGIGTGMCLTCKAAVKIDEKIYKGKLREKFADATAEATTSFLCEKFEPRRFEPKKFEFTRFNASSGPRTVDEVIFETQTEAEEVRLRLDDLIETYGWASIADFYDLVGVTHSYPDTKYGWKDGISTDLIVMSKNGWIIEFPETCEF